MSQSVSILWKGARQSKWTTFIFAWSPLWTLHITSLIFFTILHGTVYELYNLLIYLCYVCDCTSGLPHIHLIRRILLADCTVKLLADCYYGSSISILPYPFKTPSSVINDSSLSSSTCIALIFSPLSSSFPLIFFYLSSNFVFSFPSLYSVLFFFYWMRFTFVDQYFCRSILQQYLTTYSFFIPVSCIATRQAAFCSP